MLRGRNTWSVCLSLVLAGCASQASDDAASAQIEGAAGSSAAGSSGAGGEGAGSSGAGGAAGKAGAGGCLSPEACSWGPEPAVHATPPGPSEAGGPGDAGPATLVVSRWFLGDTDRQGQASVDAWKQYGFDLDGVSSDIGFVGHCKAIEGAKKSAIQIDGSGGIDNSFGKNVVQILQTFLVSPSDEFSASVSTGKYSLALRVDALSAAHDQTGLSASLLPVVGAPGPDGGLLPPPATGWSSYAWRPLSPTAGSPDPATTFAASYLTGDTLVLAPAHELSLELRVGDVGIPFSLARAVVTARLSPDHQQIVEGTLAGLLPTDSFVESFKQSAASLSPSLCDPEAFSGIANQIRAASDSLLDGTQDPTRNCEAISIGLGFEGKTALFGDQAPALPAPPSDPCGSGQP